MQEVIICKGLPGSGKSTWAKKFVEENPKYVRVNRDDLRNMRGRYWYPSQEGLITTWERNCIKSALEAGYNVIVDSTNLNPKSLNNLIYFLDRIDIEMNVEYKSFIDVPLKTCIENDLKRPNSVGASVIRRMYFQYIHKNSEYVQNENNPKAIIVDLDGTLCLFGNKNAFDRDFINDTLNVAIAKVLRGYIGHIYLFSGRNDKYQKETVEWLNKYEIPYKSLTMRKDGDTRPDYEVKKEMFDNIIRDKYYVDFVFDDRPQIIDLWKSLGLTVFNVGEGIEF